VDDPTDGDGRSVLRDMRRRRRRNRVADMEWFEALYRVYLTGLIGLGAVLFLAGLVDDAPFTPEDLDGIVRHGPHVLGLFAAVAAFLGARSGSNGGPLGIEDADVRHLLLSPVPAGAVLRVPALQRLRSDVGLGALTGAITGLLVARRTDDPAVTWIAAVAVSGACIGALRTTAALVVHGLRAPRWTVSLAVTALLAWQGTVVVTATGPGPFDAVGSLALWPIRVSVVDALAPSVIVAAATLGLVLCGRMSTEALARRSALVAQLRFAVTLQDIRTVMLLRRQLGQEHTRARPWFRVRGSRLSPATSRSLRSLARFPARRVVRIVSAAALAAAALVRAHAGDTPLIAVAGVLLFVAALDLIEPLSQEVDKAWLTDMLPVERGRLYLSLLSAPALFGILLVAPGIAVAVALRPEASTLGVGLPLAVAAVAAALAGAAISAVRGAPDPVVDNTGALYMPPEISGLTTVVRTLWPPVVSTLGCLPVVLVALAERDGGDPLAIAVRAVLGTALGTALVLGWVRKRDDIRHWWMQMQKDARR